MTIDLTPEVEALIQKRLATGAFQDASEVVYRALESQDAEDAWLSLHQRQVSDRLDDAMAEFDRGEGIPASGVRQRLQELKESHRAGRR